MLEKRKSSLRPSSRTHSSASISISPPRPLVAAGGVDAAAVGNQELVDVDVDQAPGPVAATNLAEDAGLVLDLETAGDDVDLAAVAAFEGVREEAADLSVLARAGQADRVFGVHANLAAVAAEDAGARELGAAQDLDVASVDVDRAAVAVCDMRDTDHLSVLEQALDRRSAQSDADPVGGTRGLLAEVDHQAAARDDAGRRVEALAVGDEIARQVDVDVAARITARGDRADLGVGQAQVARADAHVPRALDEDRARLRGRTAADDRGGILDPDVAEAKRLARDGLDDQIVDRARFGGVSIRDAYAARGVEAHEIEALAARIEVGRVRGRVSRTANRDVAAGERDGLAVHDARAEDRRDSARVEAAPVDLDRGRIRGQKSKGRDGRHTQRRVERRRRRMEFTAVRELQHVRSRRVERARHVEARVLAHHDPIRVHEVEARARDRRAQNAVDHRSLGARHAAQDIRDRGRAGEGRRLAGLEPEALEAEEEVAAALQTEVGADLVVRAFEGHAVDPVEEAVDDDARVPGLGGGGTGGDQAAGRHREHGRHDPDAKGDSGCFRRCGVGHAELALDGVGSSEGTPRVAVGLPSLPVSRRRAPTRKAGPRDEWMRMCWPLGKRVPQRKRWTTQPLSGHHRGSPHGPTRRKLWAH